MKNLCQFLKLPKGWANGTRLYDNAWQFHRGHCQLTEQLICKRVANASINTEHTTPSSTARCLKFWPGYVIGIHMAPGTECFEVAIHSQRPALVPGLRLDPGTHLVHTWQRLQEHPYLLQVPTWERNCFSTKGTTCYWGPPRQFHLPPPSPPHWDFSPSQIL